MNVKPLNNNVFIRPIKKNTTESGLYIPDAQSHMVVGGMDHGEVVSIGPGKRMKNGERLPIEIAIGDKVIYLRHDAPRVTHNNEELLCMDANYITAVLYDMPYFKET